MKASTGRIGAAPNARTDQRNRTNAMNLSNDDLKNIRDALNGSIHRLVESGAKEGIFSSFSEATRLAETRDKIQAEIDVRKGQN